MSIKSVIKNKFIIISIILLILFVLCIIINDMLSNINTNTKITASSDNAKPIYTYCNPIIPDCFSAVETNQASWQKDGDIIKS